MRHFNRKVLNIISISLFLVGDAVIWKMCIHTYWHTHAHFVNTYIYSMYVFKSLLVVCGLVLTHFIFCRLSMSGFKLENFCANFHTVMRKKKMFIWKATEMRFIKVWKSVLGIFFISINCLALTMMMTQAGPKKLQMKSRFNQQLQYTLRVFSKQTIVTRWQGIQVQIRNKTESASVEETYYLSVPYPLALAKTEIPTITAGTP